MPGKHKRPISIPLNRKESDYVSSILVKYFDPEGGESQLREQSEIIVNEINEKFVKKGFKPKYTSVKLSDWVSNRLYRLRKSNQIIKDKTLDINRKTSVIKKTKNLQTDIYKINLQFIDLLPTMEDIENYDFTLNKVENNYVSIFDN